MMLAALYAHGYSGVSWLSTFVLVLPAETTYRVSGWLAIAALSALVNPVKPYDALTTFNPSSPAYASAAALSEAACRPRGR